MNLIIRDLRAMAAGKVALDVKIAWSVRLSSFFRTDRQIEIATRRFL